MTRLAFASIALLAACGSRPPPPAEQSRSPTALGDVGAVCFCAEGSKKDCAPVTCKADLVCAYGCGIPGCDSHCSPPAHEGDPKIP